jgi:protease IV
MRRRRIWVGLIAIAVIVGFFFSIFYLIGWHGSRAKRFSFGGNIAVVEIKGVITQSSPIIDEIRQYEEDDGVKAIILRIDSPGGGVGASQEVYQEVLRAKKKKKVITSMGGVAASGGYYIACASDLIVANPGTITGSIGVIMQFTNLEDLLKKIGVKGFVVKAGENKDIGSPFREMTPEEKRLMQGVLDNVHQQFIQAVVEGRRLDRAKVVPIADGRILTGEQAKEVGLVDRMGNLQDAIDAAAKMAGITGKPGVVYPKKKRSLWEFFLEETTSAISEKLNLKEFHLDYLMSLPSS